jgi:hypothetical protein
MMDFLLPSATLNTTQTLTSTFSIIINYHLSPSFSVIIHHPAGMLLLVVGQCGKTIEMLNPHKKNPIPGIASE